MPAHRRAHTAPAATLKVSGLRYERADQLILDDISLILAPGDRIGVVGPNGAGKTTLLRALAGLEAPTSGSVELAPPSATVGYLAQERERPAAEVLHQYLARRAGLAQAETELGQATAALAAGDMSALAQERYSHALDRFNLLAPDNFDQRVAKVMADLGARPEVLDAPLGGLSGGELARANLAALMLARFDITLLDEPTNDLDFDGLSRLEEVVLGHDGPLMVVSHDRTFLSRTVTGVLELDGRSHQASYFDGSWGSYLAEKQTKARHAQELYRGYERSRQVLAQRAQRERQWATTGVKRERSAPDNDKFARQFRVERSEQLAARARRTDLALERLEAVEKPWEEWELRYSVKQAPRAGAVVAQLQDAVVQMGDFRLGPVSMTIAWGDRLAVTGRNGAGKTTLVQAVLGRTDLVGGHRYLGPGVVPGELGQERAKFLRPGGLQDDPGPQARGAPVDAEGLPLLTLFMDATGLSVPEARSLLAKFGLGAGHVGRALLSLSPGERTRAQLASFQVFGVNFLVMDEPTNHLDLPAIQQLEAALSAYEGTLLIVTHDRHLLSGLSLTHAAEVAGGSVSVSAV